jgi:hypothetical protein
MLSRRSQGWTYKQIGEDHGVTASRAGQVLREARDALGAATVDEAVSEAIRRGLITQGEPLWGDRQPLTAMTCFEER